MSDTTARLPRTDPRDLHEPAWRGHAVTPVDLVLEGGAMRGQFTAGVLDAFMDRGLFCERTVGVSAGALCGYNYVAGDAGRSCYLNVKYAGDWRYLSLKSFVHGQRLRARLRLQRDTQPAGALQLRRLQQLADAPRGRVERPGLGRGRLP